MFVIEKKYDVGAGSSSPLGYPVEVTVGGFSSGILNGLSRTQEWGNVTHVYGGRVQPLPRRLAVEWVSFAEGEHGKAYQINTAIDYEKMEALFDKGYELQQHTGKPNKKKTFDTVVAGFAPGGVVIVWVEGGGRMIEIGRYQGYEVTTKDSNLDPETQKLLTPYWNEFYMDNERIVPTAVREANSKRKPPYGLWDSLRQRFNYTIYMEFANSGTFIGGTTRFVNGEFKYTYPKRLGGFVEMHEEAAPRNIVLFWYTGNEVELVTEVYLEEAYIRNLFNEMLEGDKNTKLALTIRINERNDYYTVRLKNDKGREQDVKLNPNEEVEIFLAPSK